MEFIKINKNDWARKEHFDHYLNAVRCSYSLTVNIDITDIKKVIKVTGLKVYPVQIYMISTIVNKYIEFRMSFDKLGDIGYWNTASPSYTVLNTNTDTFSSIYTPYVSDFGSFYNACISDISKYATGELFPEKSMPQNIFTISSIPWLDFTSFNINVFSDGTYLSPIFTIGKFVQEADRVFMPLAIQVHHAACDGLHVGRFVDALRNMSVDSKQWLKLETL